MILEDTTPDSEGTSTILQTTPSASVAEMVVDNPALPVDPPQDPAAHIETTASGDTLHMVVDPPTSSTKTTVCEAPSEIASSSQTTEASAPKSSCPFANALGCLQKDQTSSGVCS